MERPFTVVVETSSQAELPALPRLRRAAVSQTGRARRLVAASPTPSAGVNLCLVVLGLEDQR